MEIRQNSSSLPTTIWRFPSCYRRYEGVIVISKRCMFAYFHMKIRTKCGILISFDSLIRLFLNVLFPVMRLSNPLKGLSTFTMGIHQNMAYLC